MIKDTMLSTPPHIAAALFAGKNGRLVDCSHEISPETFSFICDHDGADQAHHKDPFPCPKCGEPSDKSFSMGRFRSVEILDIRKPDGGKAFKKCVYHMACDVGTHIDSPSHWYVGARDISELTLEELVAPGVVIDVPWEKIEKNPDYALSEDDVLAWEA